MFIRVECRDQLKAALEAESSVPVLKGFETPNPSNERIHLDATSGAVSYDVFMGDTKPHDDQFSIDIYVYTAIPGRSQEQAEERTQELMNYVVKALDDANLSGAGPNAAALTVTTADFEAFVFDALLAATDGPHTAPTPEGFEGFGLIEVAVHTRSSYL